MSGGIVENIGRIAAMLVLAVGSSACNVMRQHPPTMGADPAQTGQEGQALVNELRKSFVVVPYTDTDGTRVASVATCDLTMPQHQEAQSREYSRYARRGSDGKMDFEGIPGRVGCIVYRKGDEESVRLHLEAGFAYSDYLCSIFFTRITEHSSQRRFSRGLVNDVGAAVSAVLGLSNVPAAIVGGAGAGFGLADSSFRNYDDSFLVSADLATLQKKIEIDQNKMRLNSLLEKPTNYPRANSLILRYANLCTYTGMRGLINASLTETPEKTTLTEDAVQKYVEKFMAAAQKAQLSVAPPADEDPAAGNQVDADPAPEPDNGR